MADRAFLFGFFARTVTGVAGARRLERADDRAAYFGYFSFTIAGMACLHFRAALCSASRTFGTDRCFIENYCTLNAEN